MKKLYKMIALVGTLSLAFLFLSGCQKDKSKQPNVQLSQKELALAAYLDNYIDQYQTKDVTTAIANDARQYQFSIRRMENKGYVVQNNPTIANGTTISKVSLDHNRIKSVNFNGEKRIGTQKYSKLQLELKYGKYKKQMDRLIKRANEEKDDQLTHEEVAMAIYVDTFKADDEDVPSAIERLANFPDHSMETDGDILKINIGGTGSASEEFYFEDGRVKGVTHDGIYEKTTKNYQVAEINQNFHQYKDDLKSLIDKVQNT